MRFGNLCVQARKIALTFHYLCILLSAAEGATAERFGTQTLLVMKKLIAVSLFLLSTVYPLSAGGGIFMFGIKAGYTATGMKIKDAGRYFDDSGQNGHGWHAGLQVRLNVPLIGVYVQPELVYGWAKFGSSVISIPSVGDYSLERRVSQWDIPLMVGWGIGFAGAKVRINAGPVFNLSAKSKLKGNADGEKLISDLDLPAVSYALGVGLDLWKLTFDIRYNGQFKKSNETAGIGPLVEHLKSRQHAWTFSLGVMF